MTWDPLSTQRTKFELSQTDNTDRRHVQALIEHWLEQHDGAIEELFEKLETMRKENREDYRKLDECVVREAAIKNWIAAAIAQDSSNRNRAAKQYYATIFLRYVLPSLLSGGALSELGHILGWLGHAL